MVGGHKAEHVRLQVEDPESAATFYEDTLGLSIVENHDGGVYLGCGLDENFDLGLIEGEPGVEHIAFRSEASDAIDDYARHLRKAGAQPRRTDGEEPGQLRGMRVRLPSGLSVELVDVADKRYKKTYQSALEGRGGLAPVDLNHYNYHTPDVKQDATFLRDHLDFQASAVIEDWATGAFLRRGDKHHDIAVFNHTGGPPDHASHHHTGLSVSSVDHMVRLLERLTDRGVHVEFGIGRHFGGNNLFAYVRAPDGHRIELVTEMTELDEDTPVQHVNGVEQAVSAWHGGAVEIPASWGTCSGLADSSAE
ncbi:MAG: VOC family protein [Salinirussus sp.]